jgi:hypothetical protein
MCVCVCDPLLNLLNLLKLPMLAGGGTGMAAYIPFDSRVVAEADGETAPGAARETPVVSVMRKPRPQPLDPDYPCVVCGDTVRWNHGGIWRCVVCWPPEANARCDKRMRGLWQEGPGGPRSS